MFLTICNGINLLDFSSFAEGANISPNFIDTLLYKSNQLSSRDVMRKIGNLMTFSKILVYAFSVTNSEEDVLFSLVCIHPCLCHVVRQVKMFGFAYSFWFLLVSRFECLLMSFYAHWLVT